jgi:hypothetical protein
MRIRNRHKELELQYFLHSEPLSSGHRRWIEYTGWLIDQNEEACTILSPMGAEHILKSPLIFDDREVCMFMKSKLNSEYVKQHEPENFEIPSWREAYNKTHE